MEKEKQHKEYIAFDGVKYTIEWYFDEKGKSISLDYLESLSDKEQIKLFELIKLIGDRGEIKLNLGMRVTKFILLSLSPTDSCVSFSKGKKLL